MEKYTVLVDNDLSYTVEGRNVFECKKKAIHLYKADPKAKGAGKPVYKLLEGVQVMHWINRTEKMFKDIDPGQYFKDKQSTLDAEKREWEEFLKQRGQVA